MFFLISWLAPRKKLLLGLSAVIFAVFGLLVQLAAQEGASTVDVALWGGVLQGAFCAAVLRNERVPFWPGSAYQRKWLAIRGIVSTRYQLTIPRVE
jgi:hypothetical protein